MGLKRTQDERGYTNILMAIGVLALLVISGLFLMAGIAADDGTDWNPVDNPFEEKYYAEIDVELGPKVTLSGVYVQVNDIEHRTIKKSQLDTQAWWDPTSVEGNVRVVLNCKIDDQWVQKGSYSEKVDFVITESWSDTVSCDLGPMPDSTSEYEIVVQLLNEDGRVTQEETATGTI